MNKNVKHSGVWTVFFTLLSVAYVFPIILVVINSFKRRRISVGNHLPFQEKKCL